MPQTELRQINGVGNQAEPRIDEAQGARLAGFGDPAGYRPGAFVPVSLLRPHDRNPVRLSSLQQIMIIAGKRNFFQTGSLEVTDIIDA